MATESESAVLIGFIVAIVVVGIAGGVTLTVFICLKYHEYQKRRAMTRVVPCRRSRRSRGNRRRNSIHHGGKVPTIPLTVNFIFANLIKISDVGSLMVIRGIKNIRFNDKTVHML